MNDIYTLYKIEGKNVADIASLYGVTITTIYNKMRKLGIKPEYRKTHKYNIGENNGRWRGGVSDGFYKRRIPLEKCSLCGGEPSDRHHLNGNHKDNNPKNIITICRSCHIRLDGRLINNLIQYRGLK